MYLKPIYLLLLSLFSLNAFSQDCIPYFPADQGHVLQYNNYNAKGKLISRTRKTVLKSTVTVNGLVITIKTMETTPEGINLFDNQSQVKCVSGRYFIGMKNYLNAEMKELNADYTVRYQNEFIELPMELEIGEQLPDGKIVAMANTEKGEVQHSLEVKYRQVEGIQQITTAAGTFNCYKITYVVFTNTEKQSEVLCSEWVALGVGIVKFEMYDKKERVIYRSELVKQKSTYALK